MSMVNLPVITLRRGPWQADVFDPRPHPALLGARFVHGGYVARWFRDGRELTGGTTPYWFAYDGCGLPETFESGLGWHLVGQDEEFMRPGAGRLLKKDDPSETHALGVGNTLTATLDWTVESGADYAIFRTGDQIRRRWSQRLGYRLERTIRLHDDGLTSTTAFTLDAPFARITSLPMSWYAHPFFRQTPGKIGATAYRVSAGAKAQTEVPMNPQMGPVNAAPVLGADGRWAFATPYGGRLAFTFPWGVAAAPVEVFLEGGGCVAVGLDKPYDHVVLWANDHSASVEPKLAKTWLHGETQTWTTSYRWQ